MKATQIIINKLLSNDALKELTNGAIHPVIARFGTASPYLVVRTDAVEKRYSKMGVQVGTTSTVNVLCVADSYEEMVLIADEVNKLAGDNIEISSYRETFEEPDKLVAEFVCLFNN